MVLARDLLRSYPCDAINSRGWDRYPNLIGCRQPGMVSCLMPKARRRDPDAVLFGWVIKRLREERGWSIAMLARRTAINPTHLGVLEKGGNIPSLTTILLLGNALGINGSDIVREVEQMRREAAQRRLAAKKAAAAASPPPDELKSS